MFDYGMLCEVFRKSKDKAMEFQIQDIAGLRGSRVLEAQINLKKKKKVDA